MSQPLHAIYEFTPLLEPDSIRVLVLYPASEPTAEVRCYLIGIRLCDIKEPRHDYAAISYVWGDDRDSQTIYIGIQKMTVGKNIHSALRHIRRRDVPMRIWVDAICINQSDLTERSHQVQQMRAIYAAAQETIIYLGDQDGGNTTLSAWNFLERNSEWAMNEHHEIDFSIAATLEEKRYFRGDLDDVEIDVLQRPWFRRVWVFQEVVVSRNVSIECGSRKISWNEFCRILLLNPRYHDRYGFSIGRSGRIDVVRDMFHARCNYQEAHGLGGLRPTWHTQVENYKGGDSSILNTLSRARQQEAFDPRDKIYALLGVSTGVDLSGDLIAVNYRKQCSRVYMDFARHMMDTTQSYDILSYLDDYSVGKPPDFGSSTFPAKKVPEVELHDYVLPKSRLFEMEERERLPSWVPNWDRSEWSLPSPWKFRHTGRTILSTLQAETDAQTELRQSLVSKSRIWTSIETFAAIGVIIGVVVERGPSIALVGNDELRFQDIRDRNRDDLPSLTREAMVLWQEIMLQGELTLDIGNQLVRQKPLFLPNVCRLLSSEPIDPRESVQHHLLNRGRKSVTWSDDNNKAVAFIRDRSSIVETKQVAAYQRFNEKQQIESEGLALLPSRTATPEKSRDLIVYLRGARVPFLVRQKANPTSDIDLMEKRSIREHLKSTLGIEKCTIVGECFVNGFDDVVKSCEAILKMSEAAAETSPWDFPAWTPFSNARIFLIN